MKRMALVQIRTLGRPLFKQFKKSIQLRSRVYELHSLADQFVFFHGQGEPSPEEAALLDHVNCNDGRKLTDGTICSASLEVFEEYGFIRDYEFVGLLDDDGDFTHPEVDMANFIRCFDADPKLGAAGPISSFLLWRKFKNRKGFFKHAIEGPPWTTFGCQIYRTSALRKLSWSEMIRIRFRLDVFAFLRLVTLGFKAVEIPCKFDHICNGGFNASQVNRAQIERRLRQTLDDYNAMVSIIKKQPYVEQLEKMKNAELRKYNHRLEGLKCVNPK